eukprot:TRINITY_DN60313_c0_g1_i1.p1 TRINITY_DN60313_c0_g1~~TRINITY_DN60313_c0_g1_i1.p1  ORF type:complete len:242 (-),score=47.58 TRINITY_DN60313_c0_g1_i1:298-1023(-)
MENENAATPCVAPVVDADSYGATTRISLVQPAESSTCSTEEEADLYCQLADGAPSPKRQEVLSKKSGKSVKLLPHEQHLLNLGSLRDVTHKGASAVWLAADSLTPPDDTMIVVYRPMGDIEYGYLLQHGELPASQPYQTIVRGEEGRQYAEKYLRGHKKVDSSPTTIVEFLAPRELVYALFAMQSKNEDGAISHGLGNKGGRGLPIFNASLRMGETTHRIVAVKRFEKRATGAFGAGRKKL